MDDFPRFKVSPGIIVKPDDEDAWMVALCFEDKEVKELEIPIITRQANTAFVDGLAEMIRIVVARHAQFRRKANIVPRPAQQLGKE